MAQGEEMTIWVDTCCEVEFAYNWPPSVHVGTSWLVKAGRDVNVSV